MHKSMKKWRVPLLLVLALLIAGIVAIATLTGSADEPASEPEIQHFGFQTLNELTDLTVDSPTALRFMFTIDEDKREDYTAAGFVFSKTNDVPTVGGAGCTEKPAKAVYRSITADKVSYPAPDGRYWVAVKVTNIGHEYFDDAIYVRAYVTDGEGTRYSEAKYITVCSAKGHTHAVTGSASATQLYRTGHCNGCNLDGVSEYGVTNPEYKRWIGGGSTDSWAESRQIKDFKGGKTFHPTVENPQGNDLIVEYSVLWNETLLNLSGVDVKDDKGNFVKKSARIETMFSTSKNSGNTKAIAYWSLTDNVEDSGSKIAGAFEYPNPMIQTWVSGAHMEKNNNNTANPKANYDWYPNIGGTDKDNPEWGWHRVGIIYHEDVINLDAVRDNGDDAQYKLTVTLYIDGEVVSVLSGTDLGSNSYDYKLYTVEKEEESGELVYTDITENLYLQIFGIYSAYAPTAGKDAYFIDGDLSASVGHRFALNVKKVKNPEPRTETLDNGKSFNAPFYYTPVAAHAHEWDDYETITEVSLFGEGLQRRYCSVCGASEDAEKTGDLEHHSQTWTSSSSTGDRNIGKHLLSEFREQNGDKVFYAPGNDLLVEYSILWNETALNAATGSANTYVTTNFQNANENNTDAKNIIYWSVGADLKMSDCDYAGGFEYGGIRKSAADNPYPRFTTASDNGGLGIGTAYSDFPNVGGASQMSPEWGWHRVSIRYREEVTNEAELLAYNGEGDKPDATYLLSLWVYVDGELVIHAYETDLISDKSVDRKLYTAEADGEGGITYTPNDSQALVPVKFNNQRAKTDTTVYLDIVDVSVTIGAQFVQNVEKVASPDPVDYEIAEGVHVNGARYYTLAHEHDWGEYADVYDKATLLDQTHKLQRRFCTVCHASQDQTVDASFTPDVQTWGSSASGIYTIGAHTLGEFREGKDFSVPGNDLLIEYSVLWNESLTKLEHGKIDKTTFKPFIDTRFASNAGGSQSKNLTYWTPTADNPQSDCKYAGSFEWGGIAQNEPDNPYPRFKSELNNEALYPNIGGYNNGDGTEQTNDRYGWHRVSIRYRQEVTNKEALINDVSAGATPATYKLQMWVYIDGELVIHAYENDYQYERKENDVVVETIDRKLYTAVSDGNGGINYTWNDSMYLVPFYLNSIKAESGETVYLEVEDLYVTVGGRFVQNVEKAASPTYVDYEIADGVHVNGAFYYTLVGSHEHYWGGYETIHAPTSVAGGLERRYCTICGASDEKTTASTRSHSIQKWTDSITGSYSPNKATLGTIRGDKHFYDAGNDLLVEYSILWNATLPDLNNGSGPYIDTRFTESESGNSGNKNIIYWSLTDDCDGSDCKFAGGFEWGGVSKNEAGNPYPKFTKDPTLGTLQTQYPNIGGANNGDGTEQVNNRYGWHRVSIRYREELTNKDTLVNAASGTKGTYKFRIWVYIDGKLVIHAYLNKSITNSSEGDRNLFTAAANGSGITYTENDALYLNGAYLHSKKAADGKKVYFEIADYSATIGSDFVQKVRPVENPIASTYTHDGYNLPTTVWYEYAD